MKRIAEPGLKRKKLSHEGEIPASTITGKRKAIGPREGGVTMGTLGCVMREWFIFSHLRNKERTDENFCSKEGTFST